VRELADAIIRFEFAQEILDFLDAVQNTFYLLDYYCGNDWALGLVDSDYRARLGSPLGRAAWPPSMPDAIEVVAAAAAASRRA
jgi:hypothetical protein